MNEEYNLRRMRITLIEWHKLAQRKHPIMELRDIAPWLRREVDYIDRRLDELGCNDVLMIDDDGVLEVVNLPHYEGR